MRKLYRKIDIYRVRRDARGKLIAKDYLCSTNWARTCREAMDNYRAAYPQIGHAELDARFSKGC